MVWLRGGTGRVGDGHCWLSGLSDIRLTPESNCLTQRALIFFSFLTNCQRAGAKMLCGMDPRHLEIAYIYLFSLCILLNFPIELLCDFSPDWTQMDTKWDVDTYGKKDTKLTCTTTVRRSIPNWLMAVINLRVFKISHCSTKCKCLEKLIAHTWKKLDWGFPKFDSSRKNLYI